MSEEPTPIERIYELYGRVEQLEAKVKDLEAIVSAQQASARLDNELLNARVADMEAKTEPLQEVTNALNEFRQRLDAMDKMGQIG